MNVVVEHDEAQSGQVAAATIEPVIKELDTRLVDTDHGRYDIRLYWDESRGEVMLASLSPDGDYIESVYIAADKATDAFLHPVIYLDLH